jgi:hypothetical protein
MVTLSPKSTNPFSQLAIQNPKILLPLPHPFTHLSLPYIQGTTDHISRILAKKNIKTFFKPCKTLKQFSKLRKDKSDPMLGPRVYQIPCSCGKSYIGQTTDPLKPHSKNT